MKKSDYRNGTIEMYLKELTGSLAEQRYQTIKHQASQGNRPITSSEVNFERFASDVAIHYCDLIEQQDAQSSVIIPACISITVLLIGKLNFDLNNTHYQIACSDNTAKLFINTIAESTNFTRYMTKQQEVKKVTLSFDQQWILNRASSAIERQQLLAFMMNKTQVLAFNCSTPLKQVAEQLIYHKSQKAIIHQITAERLSLELISQALTVFFTKENKTVCLNSETTKLNQETEFCKHFKSFIETNKNVEEIAIDMGLSISNLQRKVKGNFGRSAMSYLKEKRLDNAKNLLIEDGLSIGEVAYLCGYAHSANFVTAFKKHHGQPPAKLRLHSHA